MTTLNDVCEDIRRITFSCDLPLLVDADTGWGDAFMIGRTIREMSRAGASGCHIEDQVSDKRCGHRPGKILVSAEEMQDRIKAAVDARKDDSFAIIARTDAHGVEGQLTFNTMSICASNYCKRIVFSCINCCFYSVLHFFC